MSAGASATSGGSGLEEARLPTVVNAPGTWSNDDRLPEAVAAVGFAERTTRVGVFDSHETLEPFVTSALDGRSTWLDLPGFSPERAFHDDPVVSPDGRWLGWRRVGRHHGVAGWSVLDTTTGDVRRLELGRFVRVRDVYAELAFSGDSRYLLTSFEVRGDEGGRTPRFVAWDVADGRPTVLEEPGVDGPPGIGYADTGVVWSRGHEVVRADVETGRRTTVTLPRRVLAASWGPGDAAFAYHGRGDRTEGEPLPDDHLYVGRTPEDATLVVDLPETSPIGEFLAWRDATHVVVGNFRSQAYVVDVTDGSVETVDLDGYGKLLNTANLALRLWERPLRDPVAPVGADDPRRASRWVALAAFVALIGLGVALVRRVDREAGRGPAVPGPGEPTGPGTAEPVGSELPPAGWAVAWLFLVGQCVTLADRGVSTNSLVGWVVSMALSALVVRWFALGVLQGRTGRMVVVWVLVSATAALWLLDVLAEPGQAGLLDVVSLGLTLAQLAALVAFGLTGFFAARRARTQAPHAVVAPVLALAVATGLLGGLTAPQTPDSSPFRTMVDL